MTSTVKTDTTEIKRHSTVTCTSKFFIIETQAGQTPPIPSSDGVVARDGE